MSAEAISKLQDNLGALQDIVINLQKTTIALQDSVLAVLERVKRLEARQVCIEMPLLDKAMTAAVNKQVIDTVKAQASKAKEN